jgi:hypothetical protein
MLKYAVIPVAGLIAGAGFLITTWNAAGQQTEHSATIPMVARDQPDLPPGPVPPPPGPGYCGAPTAGSPYPPNAVFGKLTIGGALAPAETLVTLTFNGKPGPSVYTAEAGGYKVNYAAGGQGHNQPCINEVGTELGLLVNGVHVPFGALVGPQTGLAFRYDIALP